MKDWTRKIIGLSLVALFAGYYGGTTLFYHAHEIDGVKIVRIRATPSTTRIRQPRAGPSNYCPD
mgnify:CR=1 FL=1